LQGGQKTNCSCPKAGGGRHPKGWAGGQRDNLKKIVGLGEKGTWVGGLQKGNPTQPKKTEKRKWGEGERDQPWGKCR